MGPKDKRQLLWFTILCKDVIVEMQDRVKNLSFH